jgi:hypothetical protein
MTTPESPHEVHERIGRLKRELDSSNQKLKLTSLALSLGLIVHMAVGGFVILGTTLQLIKMAEIQNPQQ